MPPPRSVSLSLLSATRRLDAAPAPHSLAHGEPAVSFAVDAGLAGRTCRVRAVCGCRRRGFFRLGSSVVADGRRGRDRPHLPTPALVTGARPASSLVPDRRSARPSADSAELSFERAPVPPHGERVRGVRSMADFLKSAPRADRRTARVAPQCLCTVLCRTHSEKRLRIFILPLALRTRAPRRSGRFARTSCETDRQAGPRPRLQPIVDRYGARTRVRAVRLCERRPRPSKCAIEKVAGTLARGRLLATRFRFPGHDARQCAAAAEAPRS
jgi:hypothetical protein